MKLASSIMQCNSPFGSKDHCIWKFEVTVADICNSLVNDKQLSGLAGENLGEQTNQPWHYNFLQFLRPFFFTTLERRLLCERARLSL